MKKSWACVQLSVVVEARRYEALSDRVGEVIIGARDTILPYTYLTPFISFITDAFEVVCPLGKKI